MINPECDLRIQCVKRSKKFIVSFSSNILNISFAGSCLFVCLFVFYVPSTARSFRDGTPIYCPLRRMCSSVNTLFPPGIEPCAVVWQSITLMTSISSD